jgi:hypothetical protein
MMKNTLSARSNSWIEFWSESESLSSVICSQAWSVPYAASRMWASSWCESSGWGRREFDSKSWSTSL